jgi:hypothetical protein
MNGNDRQRQGQGKDEYISCNGKGFTGAMNLMAHRETALLALVIDTLRKAGLK